MTAAVKWNLVSVEDYLSGELVSSVRHEYLGGVVHAMAGARVVHNDITSNVHLAVGSRLRGKPCRVYSSDMKIRIRRDDQVTFYYPDLSVICRSNPATDLFQDEPAVIFEVLSKATRRIDTGEKKDAYLTIPSLQVYAVVEQDSPLIIVFRRSGKKFEREVHSGLDASISLAEIGVDLPLAEVYDRVEFTPEPDNDAG
ncbi:MAG TPA: Uma2 family endonuclease [Gemmataceae bacterium]|nr:Uma2 family endonuclease [Gemmataceae bacterium]